MHVNKEHFKGNSDRRYRYKLSLCHQRHLVMAYMGNCTKSRTLIESALAFLESSLTPVHIFV